MIDIKRDTTIDLFKSTVRLAKENGCFDRAADIIDYILPDDTDDNGRIHDVIELSNYEFDFIAVVGFGGSEGIYIDCYIAGNYTETPIMNINYNEDIKQTLIKETRRAIGTIKTLRTDLEAMQIMGELCGVLTYYATQYINQNFDRYTPTAQLLATKRIKEDKVEGNHEMAKSE